MLNKTNRNQKAIDVLKGSHIKIQTMSGDSDQTISVLSESLLFAQWILDWKVIAYANSEDSDQHACMRRLVCVFAVRTCHNFRITEAWLSNKRVSSIYTILHSPTKRPWFKDQIKFMAVS